MDLATVSLSEQEEKIATLERTNFDLKLQVYYLNRKIADGAAQHDIDPDQATVNLHLNEDINSDILTLKDDLELANRRIEELESELLQLQLLRDNEALEYQKLLQNQPSSDISLLEETRKRDHDVAKTIAEHDAQLINKLRLELESMQHQHERDIKLVEDCTARLASQMEIFEATTGDMIRIREENTELLSKIAVLTDTARQQELLLSEASANRIDPKVHEVIRKENSQLKEQLEKQKASISNQSEVLRRLGSAASTESQEMIRLATELDVCYTARDDAILQQQKLQYENDVLRMQLHELKSINALGQTEEGVGSIPELSPSSFHRHIQTTGLGPSSLDTKLAEAYKKRELDLLNALEGVIQRCKELEVAQFQQQVEHHEFLNLHLLQQQQQQQQLQQVQQQGNRAALTASSLIANLQPGSQSVPQTSRNSRSRGEVADRGGGAGNRSKSTERRRSAWH